MSAPSVTDRPGPLAALGEDWHHFWHSSGPVLSLGLFRIAFAYALFREVSVTRTRSLFAVEGGFHLPYPYVPSFIHPIPVEAFQLVQTLQYPLILLLGLGLLMRPAIAGLLALQGYVFFSDALTFRNHPYFFLLALLALLFSPAEESVSLVSVWRMVRVRRWSIETLIGPIRPLTCQRMIMVQVCLVYFLAGLQKINPAFLNGAVLLVQMNASSAYWGQALIAILGNDTGARIQAMLLSQKTAILASVGTLILEMAFPFTLWFRETRAPSLIVGVSFHLAIIIFMRIHDFSFAMIGSYLLFLEPGTLPALARRLSGQGRAGPRRQGSGPYRKPAVKTAR